MRTSAGNVGACLQDRGEKPRPPRVAFWGGHLQTLRLIQNEFAAAPCPVHFVVAVAFPIFLFYPKGLREKLCVFRARLE